MWCFPSSRIWMHEGIREEDASPSRVVRSGNVTVRARRRRTHWQSRKRERIPRVANRASDCRSAGAARGSPAVYGGGRREGCCQLEWTTAQDLPPRARASGRPFARARACSRSYNPRRRRRRVLPPPPPPTSSSQLAAQLPAVPRASDNLPRVRSFVVPAAQREKTEKSSFSFAHRGVSGVSLLKGRGEEVGAAADITADLSDVQMLSRSRASARRRFRSRV